MTPASAIPAFLTRELAPAPGRAAAVLRMTAACVLTMLLVLAFRLPNGFLAVFYALAVSREDPAKLLRDGWSIVLGNAAGFLVALGGMVLFLDRPLPHFLFLVVAVFLAFFLLRTLASYSAAFGFSVILVAASSVNVIWSRPNPFRPDVNTVLGTAFGMMCGALAALTLDWLFAGPPPAAPTDTVPSAAPPRRLFVADAFHNPAHQLFAFKGALAALVCYLVWNALGWPGLGVCTVTCLIAAPSPAHGSARRRLVTRLLGLLTGGLVCGIGSQVFVLPWLDSITGFTLCFALVSAAAAWIATAGPRFAYFGRQMALAYYLTIFQGWGPATSLVTSRDRLAGILLGLLVTWLVFDSGALSVLPRAPQLRAAA